MLSLEGEIAVLERIAETWKLREKRIALALRYSLESHLGQQLKPVTDKDKQAIEILHELEESSK